MRRRGRLPPHARPAPPIIQVKPPQLGLRGSASARPSFPLLGLRPDLTSTTAGLPVWYTNTCHGLRPVRGRAQSRRARPPRPTRRAQQPRGPGHPVTPTAPSSRPLSPFGAPPPAPHSPTPLDRREALSSRTPSTATVTPKFRPAMAAGRLRRGGESDCGGWLGAAAAGAGAWHPLRSPRPGSLTCARADWLRPRPAPPEHRLAGSALSVLLPFLPPHPPLSPRALGPVATFSSPVALPLKAESDQVHSQARRSPLGNPLRLLSLSSTPRRPLCGPFFRGMRSVDHPSPGFRLCFLTSWSLAGL